MAEPASKKAKLAKELTLGIFGGGVVGGGVVEILRREKVKLESRGVKVTVKKICVRDASKKRDFEIPNGCEIVTDFDTILEDPEIDTVLELMGGTTKAKDVVFKAITQNKNVITANKALIAAFMTELIALLQKHPSVNFLYEAAVGGGIPIINTLQCTFPPDSVSRMCGIMNGTTNFMLSKMASEGADYGVVLKEAQDLGFAEADPTADVEGLDVQAKIAILCKLAFGIAVNIVDIPTKGISSLTSDDFSYAEKMKSTIKLLGMAVKNEDGSLSVFVSPVVVPLSNVIGNVNGATNIVNITSTNLIESSLVGPGAGRFPTANSVVQDIYLLAKEQVPEAFPAAPPGRTIPVNPVYSACFYIRLHIRDGVGIIKTLGELCEDQDVGIHAILQNKITNVDDVKFVVCTENCSVSAVSKMCDKFSRQAFCLSPPLFMPILK